MGPRRGLRWRSGLAGGGGGASPRLTARWSWSCSLRCFAEMGLRLCMAVSAWYVLLVLVLWLGEEDAMTIGGAHNGSGA